MRPSTPIPCASVTSISKDTITQYGAIHILTQFPPLPIIADVSTYSYRPDRIDTWLPYLDYEDIDITIRSIWYLLMPGFRDSYDPIRSPDDTGGYIRTNGPTCNHFSAQTVSRERPSFPVRMATRGIPPYLLVPLVWILSIYVSHMMARWYSRRIAQYRNNALIPNALPHRLSYRSDALIPAAPFLVFRNNDAFANVRFRTSDKTPSLQTSISGCSRIESVSSLAPLRADLGL